MMGVQFHSTEKIENNLRANRRERRNEHKRIGLKKESESIIYGSVPPGVQLCNINNLSTLIVCACIVSELDWYGQIIDIAKCFPRED